MVGATVAGVSLTTIVLVLLIVALILFIFGRR